MIGDKIKITPKYLEPAQQFLSKIGTTKEQFVVCISGESGSGKSTLAVAIQHLLTKKSISSRILHMDDYFILPPKTNHDARLKDINHVGPSEVNLELLSSHVQKFIDGEKFLSKPLVDYQENKITSETIILENVSCLIIEGTYAGTLKNCDYNIFINRTYKDTYEARIARARDPIIPFNERVLAIEHQIISKLKSNANYLMDKNYQISNA